MEYFPPSRKCICVRDPAQFLCCAIVITWHKEKYESSWKGWQKRANQGWKTKSFSQNDDDAAAWNTNEEEEEAKFSSSTIMLSCNAHI
jgi:hypothetical protein